MSIDFTGFLDSGLEGLGTLALEKAYNSGREVFDLTSTLSPESLESGVPKGPESRKTVVVMVVMVVKDSNGTANKRSRNTARIGSYCVAFDTQPSSQNVGVGTVPHQY